MLLDRPGDQVVDGDDLVAAVEQRPAQVGAEEAGAAGDDDRDVRHQRAPARRRRSRSPARAHRAGSSRLRVSTIDRVRAITAASSVEVELGEVGPLGEHDEHVGAARPPSYGVAGELDAGERLRALVPSAPRRRSGRRPGPWRRWRSRLRR